jgi:hypothetical protein
VLSCGNYGTPCRVQQVDNAIDAPLGKIETKLNAMLAF